ncbi:hypothetical protein [Priestia megaterium]|uniref:hypothetical protein n=1 Tax=Priestia megaterium TaxID=1404 RepID=UPI001A9461DA|nr:hypothetical protein [Priestia megaterium]QSX24459.1 hypothetical protein J0P05_33050 [Priestia megaterium]
MKLVRFSFFYHNTSINRITDHDTLEEVEANGLESVADKCIEEIKQSIGLDLKELAKPNDYLAFCSFIELHYKNDKSEIIEKRRIGIK